MSIRGIVERFRRSLFYVPMIWVAASAIFAHVILYLDLQITEQGIRLPAPFAATVESARALLGTVAAATITFAGIAFSISLLMIQIASSQFSPRVLYSFFRDGFVKRIMGIAVGTFTYCLLVLRVVRQPIEENGTPLVPSISVLVAVVLGVATVLAILALINHSAHSMEVAEIIRRITEDEHETIAEICPDAAGEGKPIPPEGPLPEGSPFTVRSKKDGWIESVNAPRVVRALPAGGIGRLEAGAGMFVARGAPICTIWPKPENPDEVTAEVRGALRLGRTRTMEQDLALGFRQLVDIALRALSPGINDPTTATEVIVHLGSVLRHLMMRDLPPRVLAGEDGRRLFRPKDLSIRDYVELTFDQMRLAAAEQPAVLLKMLEVMAPLIADLNDAGLESRAVSVRLQADMILTHSIDSLPAFEYERLKTDAARLGFVV